MNNKRLFYYTTLRHDGGKEYQRIGSFKNREMVATEQRVRIHFHIQLLRPLHCTLCLSVCLTIVSLSALLCTSVCPSTNLSVYSSVCRSACLLVSTVSVCLLAFNKEHTYSSTCSIFCLRISLELGRITLSYLFKRT